MLGLSLYILGNKNHMINHLFFLFLWEENRMAIRAVPIFMIQKLLHILPLVPVLQVVLLVPILQVYQSYHQENA